MDLAYLKKISRLAAVGALACGMIAYAGLSSRADNYTSTSPAPGAGGDYELNSDNPVTINVTTTVNELVHLTTTDMNFGTIGIHQDKTTATKATVQLVPTTGTGTITDSHAGATARIVADTGSSGVVKSATVALTGAFPSVVVYVHYSRVADLVCTSGATCLSATLEQGGTVSPYHGASPPTLLMTHIADDMGTLTATGDLGTAGTSGHCDESAPNACTSVDGHATTTAGGALTFSIGGTLSTDGTTKYYASGVYTGSFDLTLSY